MDGRSLGFRQDQTLSLEREDQNHFDGVIQLFSLCLFLLKRKSPFPLLQGIVRHHPPRTRQCKQCSKRGLDAVGSREQSAGIKNGPVHRLGTNRLVVRDLSDVEAHLPHGLFDLRIVLLADCIGEEKLRLPFRGVHFKGNGGSRSNQDAVGPLLGNHKRSLRDAETAPQITTPPRLPTLLVLADIAPPRRV